MFSMGKSMNNGDFPPGNLLELHAELQLPLAALLPLLALLVERAVEVQKDQGEIGICI